jgi:hypothetical protein
MRRLQAPVLLILVGLLALAPTGAAAAGTPTNIDVSQRHLNESEEAIAVNPTNPNNIVVLTNIQEGFSGPFLGVSRSLRIVPLPSEW